MIFSETNDTTRSRALTRRNAMLPDEASPWRGGRVDTAPTYLSSGSDIDGALSAITALVGRSKRVVAFGPAPGPLVHALQDAGCQVVTIATDDESAAALAGSAGVLVNELDSHDLARQLGHDRFDVIVAADVLAQAPDPLALLLLLASYLHPDGYLVVSTVNAAHLGIRLELLSGQLQRAGIDHTHRAPRRLYTRASFEQLMADAGCLIERLEREIRRVDAGSDHSGLELPAEAVEALALDPEATTYRFVVAARPSWLPMLSALEHRVQQLVADRFAARVAGLASREEELRQALAELSAGSARRAQSIQSVLLSLETNLEHARTALSDLCAAGRGNDQGKQIAYRRLIHQIRGVVRAALPPNATVLVIARGDDALLRLDVRSGWHFPQTSAGVYAGYHPANSGEAVAHLEMLRAKGGAFLLVPSTGLWWLEYYAEFKQHLGQHYCLVVDRPEVCLIYDLAAGAGRRGRALS